MPGAIWFRSLSIFSLWLLLSITSQTADAQIRFDLPSQPLAKALTAVGEALFFFAEKKREKLEALKFPVYKGNGSKEDVMKHITTKVKPWMDKKTPLIKEA